MKHILHGTMLFVVVALNVVPAAADGTETLAEPTGTLLLARAIALAEERHPDLAAARLESQAAGSLVSQAGAPPNPSISFESENFGGRDGQEGFKAAEYTVQIEQTIELGGKRGRRVKVARAAKQLSDLDLEACRLDIRAETSRRFIGVLGAQERESLARDNVALAEHFVKAVGARVESGKVAPMELEKAHVLLAQKRVELEQAGGDLRTARIMLAAQWGSASPAFDLAEGDLAALPSVPPLKDLETHLAANPDVARWSVESQRAESALSQERRTAVPDLTIAAGIRRANETGSDTFVAGVSLPLPVFDLNRGNIRAATSSLAKVGQQRRSALLKGSADLAAAHQLLTTASFKAAALKDGVLPRVKAVLEAVQSGYSQGKYSYLDVIDAQRTLIESKAEYLESLISAHTAMADLERAAGGQLKVGKQD